MPTSPTSLSMNVARMIAYIGSVGYICSNGFCCQLCCKGTLYIILCHLRQHPHRCTISKDMQKTLMRHTMRGRRYLWLFLMLTISLSILLGISFSQAPAALAHAFVIGSDPVDGSTITSAPSVIRIF